MKQSRFIYKNVNEREFLILRGDVDRLMNRIRPYLKKNSLCQIINPEYQDYMLDITIGFHRLGFEGHIYIIFRDIKREDFYQIVVRKFHIESPPSESVKTIVEDKIRWGEFRDHAIDYIAKCIEEFDKLQL